MMRKCCAIAGEDENHCSLGDAIMENARKLSRCVAQEVAFHRSRGSRSGSLPRSIIVDAGSSWRA